MEYRKEYDRESLIGTEYEYLLHEDDDLYDEDCVEQNNKIDYGNSITGTLLLRVVARSCLVCGYLAHKR